VVTKSSAVSVSSLLGLAGRESVAIRPSGFPVLKVNVSAAAGAVSRTAMAPALTLVIRALPNAATLRALRFSDVLNCPLSGLDWNEFGCFIDLRPSLIVHV
jgi:hypothetical protein